MDNQYYDMDSLNNQNGPKKEHEKSGTKFWWGVIAGFSVTFILMSGVIFVILTMRTVLHEKKDPVSVIESGMAETDIEPVEGINQTTFDKLKEIEGYVNNYFYLHEVTTDELEDGIFKGMMDSLNDPYSVYYTQEELIDLMQETAGYYYGIGAYVSIDQDYLMPKISGVIANSPAEEAKLRADDVIYEIDGESTYQEELTEAVSKIKGEEGTEVVLTILRDGELLTVPVTRRKVESPTVTYKMLENDLGYIQITEFSYVSEEQFKEALSFVRENNAKGLILDLRGNPGGSLSSVLNIARQILPKGLIVYTEEKSGHRDEYTCDGTKELELPLVVLVDGNSASASEILSGAIQDYGIGTLVGTTTYGKGIVQQIIQLEDDSAIKVTISSYYTPNGRNIHGIGIEPDIVCEFDAELYYNETNPVDNQLEKAKEVLLEKIKNEVS